MNVILLTVFLGLILVAMAIVFFFYTSSTAKGSSPERDSLLPLQEELNLPQNHDASPSASNQSRISAKH